MGLRAFGRTKGAFTCSLPAPPQGGGGAEVRFSPVPLACSGRSCAGSPAAVTGRLRAHSALRARPRPFGSRGPFQSALFPAASSKRATLLT